MFKAIILSKKYWVSVCFTGIAFILIFSILEHIMEYGITLDSFMSERIDNGKWIRYLISRVVGGLLYGMIMGYYLELRKRKSNR